MSGSGCARGEGARSCRTQDARRRTQAGGAGRDGRRRGTHGSGTRQEAKQQTAAAAGHAPVSYVARGLMHAKYSIPAYAVVRRAQIANSGHTRAISRFCAFRSRPCQCGHMRSYCSPRAVRFRVYASSSFIIGSHRIASLHRSPVPFSVNSLCAPRGACIVNQAQPSEHIRPVKQVKSTAHSTQDQDNNSEMRG